MYIYNKTGRRHKHQSAFQCRCDRAPFLEAKESLREWRVETWTCKSSRGSAEINTGYIFYM